MLKDNILNIFDNKSKIHVMLILHNREFLKISDFIVWCKAYNYDSSQMTVYKYTKQLINQKVFYVDTDNKIRFNTKHKHHKKIRCILNALL